MFILDPRVKDWLLLRGFKPTILLSMAYLLMVAYGPKLMANRKPFQLTWLLIPYNLSMALLNLYIAVQVIKKYTYLAEGIFRANS